MSKSAASDVYPLVYKFLVKCGFVKTSASLLVDTKRSAKSMNTAEDLVDIYDSFLQCQKKKVCVDQVYYIRICVGDVNAGIVFELGHEYQAQERGHF